MSNAVSARALRPHRGSRDAKPSLLRHWSDVPPSTRGSDVPPNEPPSPPSSGSTPEVTRLLRDLVAWAADLAIALTKSCPEDRQAIDQVRAYVEARLAGERCPELELGDVLITTAVLMSAIDLRVRRDALNLDDDERTAVGAGFEP